MARPAVALGGRGKRLHVLPLGLACVLAWAAASLATSSTWHAGAFVGHSTSAPVLRSTGRELGVAREVKYNRAKWDIRRDEGMSSKTDAELHQIIAEGRRSSFMYRWETWQKKEPSKEKYGKKKYLIALAKTLLAQRKIDENAKKAKELGENKEPNPTWSEMITKEEVDNSFERYAAKPGNRHSTKRRPMSGFGLHRSLKSKEWAEENLPESKALEPQRPYYKPTRDPSEVVAEAEAPAKAEEEGETEEEPKEEPKEEPGEPEEEEGDNF